MLRWAQAPHSVCATNDGDVIAPGIRDVNLVGGRVYNSGHPVNLLRGEATNGDKHRTNGRTIGAPRNSSLGANYIDADVRLSWWHKLGERPNLQLTAEGLNVANRTNYGSVNNQVGPLFAIPA